jgi:lycopene beta-cyclase
MVVYEMLQSGRFDEKEILLLDKDPKRSNDRTWCFWEKSRGEFDTIVSKSWKQVLFANDNFKNAIGLSPYEYKMIRGLDFYNLVFDKLSTAKNIHFTNENVVDFAEHKTYCTVKTTVQDFSCSKIFNSILNLDVALAQDKYPVLRQHFTGWFIKTEQSVFNDRQATFMDFSIRQHGNTRFMYVLPTSPTEALVEYTLFSKDLLPQEEYDTAISAYLQKLSILDFDIVGKERGSIPMTSYKFWQKNSKNILHIGSAGGWTKASTGFTFKNTQKKAKSLAAFLQTRDDLRKFHKTSRFWFYDLLLLDILDAHNEKGCAIFSSLFAKGDETLILRFLEEETSFTEDLKVIWKCPKRLFARALLDRLLK